MADLVVSAEMRARVRDDAQTALAPYELSEKDSRRLQALASDRGMKAGNLIHNSFRLGMVADTLPKTRAVLGEQRFEQHIREYWRRVPSKNYRYAQEAFRFGDYLLAAMEAEQLDDPYLEEVLQYELTTVRVLQQKNPPPRLIEFRHDPEVLLPALDDPDVDARALDVEEGEYYVLVRRLPSGDLDARPIPPELAAQLTGAG